MCGELKGRTQLSVRCSSAGVQVLCSIGSHTGTSVQVSHRDSKGRECEEGDEKKEKGRWRSHERNMITFGQSSRWWTAVCLKERGLLNVHPYVEGCSPGYTKASKCIKIKEKRWGSLQDKHELWHWPAGSLLCYTSRASLQANKGSAR